jgi:hypothetical protein
VTQPCCCCCCCCCCCHCRGLSTPSAGRPTDLVPNVIGTIVYNTEVIHRLGLLGFDGLGFEDLAMFNRKFLTRESGEDSQFCGQVVIGFWGQVQGLRGGRVEVSCGQERGCLPCHPAILKP